MTAAQTQTDTETEQLALAMASSKEWRDRYYETKDTCDSAVADRERLRTENRVLRLRLSGPTDEKASGLARAAHEAMTAFYAAIKDARDCADREYADAGVFRKLLDAAGAIMHLPVELRANLDDLMPAIEGFYALDELGYMTDRYDHRREQVERFLAIELVRRTVGLPSRSKTKDPEETAELPKEVPF